MAFEYDKNKSAANKAKHGIDFVEAQEIWKDPKALEFPSREGEEPRYLAIGKIGAKLWSAIYTMRGDTIRIISVRRSRREERKDYEG